MNAYPIESYIVCNLGLFVTRRRWMDMVEFANDSERLLQLVEVPI